MLNNKQLTKKEIQNKMMASLLETGHLLKTRGFENMPSLTMTLDKRFINRRLLESLVYTEEHFGHFSTKIDYIIIQNAEDPDFVEINLSNLGVTQFELLDGNTNENDFNKIKIFIEALNDNMITNYQNMFLEEVSTEQRHEPNVQKIASLWTRLVADVHTDTQKVLSLTMLNNQLPVLAKEAKINESIKTVLTQLQTKIDETINDIEEILDAQSTVKVSELKTKIDSILARKTIVYDG